ncbi:MAG: hypothetical protein KBB33_03235 [Candidatus Cloacimonetes bacterium]|nr:hypothetical protein [Candidatus Cloacimonadota bacterium]HOA29474.1 hypothetical protein [Candidatus Cloacimonadota bacterium]
MIKYAPYGSEGFNRYIDESLKDIAVRFDALFSRDELIALVLGGGYGRNEGGVLNVDNEEKLYNDLDFFVISKDMPPWKNAHIDRTLKNLHYELCDKYDIEVDFSDLKPVNSLAKTPLTLMWYDLLYGHKVIWGNKHVLQNLPRWEAKDLGINEALKLLLNRGIGLYFARSHLLHDVLSEHCDFINRNIHKAYQAVAEAILITEGKYHWSVNRRMELIKEAPVAEYCNDARLPDLMQEAMLFKLRPYYIEPIPKPINDRLQMAIDTFEQVYYACWAKYFGVPKLDLKSYQNLLSSHKDQQNSVMSLAKNFALNLRDCGITPANMTEYIKYPRYRLFYTLPWLLFGAEMTNESVARMLGVQGDIDRDSLEKRYISLWQRYN